MMEKIKNWINKNKNLLISIISITFIIAIFVCVLCDSLLNRTLTWSLYPMASCILVWLTLLPLIKLKKHNIIVSMCIFSLLVIPFLFLIEYACPIKDWVIPLGMPISIISLIYLWIVGVLLIKSKLRKWYTISIITLLTAPVTYYINTWASEFSQKSNNFSNIINAISILCLSLIFFFIGFATKKKEQYK